MLRYVVINPSVPGGRRTPTRARAVIDYIQKKLPLGEKIFDRDGVIAYRVNQAPLPARQSIAFGTEAAHVYQAEGWDRDESIADANANWGEPPECAGDFPGPGRFVLCPYGARAPVLPTRTLQRRRCASS